jgi:hypothetical protein
MHSKNLLIDDGGDGKTVETIGEGFPQLDVISSFTFIVESVYTVDGGAFVVSAQNEKVFGIFDLVR